MIVYGLGYDEKVCTLSISSRLTIIRSKTSPSESRWRYNNNAEIVTVDFFSLID